MRSVGSVSVNTKNLMYCILHMAGFVKTSDRAKTQISERRRTPMQANADNALRRKSGGQTSVCFMCTLHYRKH